MAKYKPAAPEINDGYEESVAAIDSAIRKVPPEELESAQFLVKVIYEILHTAEVEYEAGIANNKIVARIEYQDARGFVLYAEEFYDNFYRSISAENQAINSSLQKLKTAFPSVNPPITPVMRPKQFSEIVARVRQS